MESVIKVYNKWGFIDVIYLYVIYIERVSLLSEGRYILFFGGGGHFFRVYTVVNIIQRILK